MYYGKKRLQYTKMFDGGQKQTRDRWAELDRLSWRHGPPKDVVGAILQWIDENLPDSIKKGINFSKATKVRIDFETDIDYCNEQRYGSMTFCSDRVIITCQKRKWSIDSDWKMDLDYADPNMFDHIATALRRIYNGT